MSEPEWLTIAQAAKQIGVSERSIRHALSKPENTAKYAADIRQETRQTRTGTRQTTLISAALLPSLRPPPEIVENAAERGEANAAKDRQNAAEPGESNPAERGALAVLYQQILLKQESRLKEKDSHIEDLQARVVFLEEALKREQENVARAQLIKALAPLQETEQANTDNQRPNVAGTPQRRSWWMFWQKKS